MPVLDLQHEIARRVEDCLNRGFSAAGVDEAGSKKIAGVGVLKADLAAELAGNDPETAGPDLVRLKPLAALVGAGSGARRDLVDGDLADDEKGVLEGVVVDVGFERHGV